jgi:enamine deaminase RidA (YjgF/YER057c/UK114 family)
MSPELPLSPHRQAGDLVFVSGQIGVEDDGNPPADFRRQAELGMLALRKVLAESGASLADVVKTTVFVTDQAYVAAMNEVYSEYFGPPWPTRSTLVTGLALPGLLFEIEAVAAVPRP